ncbi:ABC transporter ATP-binding protein [Clostridium botulinum]|uniref:ABC transporter ATP-binding protein n=1 Tax=Clostridium botulinum TaxID=1491 RepID=UPI0006A72908|nr:ABC transporter ATP-binding protein [Clostridium botulinum]KOM98152.1 ABC transporter ATP-binding protein [Clostridium botulinum]KOM99689.1 ABC transporter ATP-binding protein [Clostridium botulinum]MBY7005913.1 ABC transporter ATP-binding protein [Clostridium botulinum]MCR1148284.1 ABC transporter ATP-binding protein [Clostridium botulinum]NFH94713.1 ABC transporter ATP-binding protein [Clostridium botulinum]
MLVVKGLCKNYNKFKAVNNVSFDVNEGEIAVLLGPNGAGKSTSIKAIAALLKFQGEISICGKDNKSLGAKSKFAYVPEVPALYDLLTVYEHVEYMANAYKVKDYKDKAEHMLKRFDLWDKKDKLGSELSKGMQQKVSICAALITNPKVILFDEPMIGLDPKAIKELKKVFLELKEEGTAVIISTHIIDSISEIWDKALIMKEGNIVFARTKQELIDKNESLEEIFFEVTEG